MRILLIAEEDEEFQTISAHLNGIQGSQHRLSWCQADLSVLVSLAVTQFQLVIWGRVSDKTTARNLLVELNRQHPEVPVVMIVDNAPKHVDAVSLARGESDFLLRSTLSVETLSRAIDYAFSPASSNESVAKEIKADPLTGLGNRQDFRDQLSAILGAATKSNTVGLLLIDVDQFKKVNASYGQGAGDALIQLIAERIRSSLSESQYLSRIGGNEFAVLFEDPMGKVQTSCKQCVDSIIEAMSKPFPVAQHAVRMHVSVGIAQNLQANVTVDQMLANADTAMRVAKREKGSNYQVYSTEMTAVEDKTLRLESEMRKALRNNEFELYYQPRIDISQNKIVGAEGLIRWRHPKRGLLPPSEFISVAEETGMIMPLGYWIIHQACSDLNILASKGHHDVQLAVNVSFKQFQDPKFVDTVANILEKQAISEGRLEFELTETTMMIEGQSVDKSLKRLSQLGIDISLDDFGTGYSSFAHIQRLPISVLKIDRSFVSSVNTNEDDATIVRAIINLAHSLSMQVIAEGAETSEQIEFLCLNKCDQVQGYFFSKPITFSDLKQLLNQEDFVDQHIQSVIADNSKI
ncbi:MAG: bifunctional diguanylate cyclase/phosphodiesterase [Pseudohongiellaceae bacterium]|nr:bifunctional diguanylate cyclase/phosphodiesterase [Pseudohongiellaceae bacterium]